MRGTCVEMNSVQFRRAMGQFATGVTVVTTRDKTGAPYGVAVNSFASLSLDPPLVQWSLKANSFSWPIFAAAEMFAVNILAAGQEAVCRNFCKPHDRFAQIDCEDGLNGLPLIRECLAWVECAKENVIEAGDHWIIVGRVLRTHTFERTPLLYWRGRYVRIPDSNRTLDECAYYAELCANSTS
jgi:4-hydroxyphenylacetate 3-hydroxylase, reductase component